MRVLTIIICTCFPFTFTERKERLPQKSRRSKSRRTHVFRLPANISGIGGGVDGLGFVGHAGFVAEMEVLGDGLGDDGEDKAVDLQHQMRQQKQQ